MTDFEKLGVFYLGRKYDLDAKKPTGDLILYDSKDLVTHALSVGMTGSGKTGLGIVAIEEAAIDGVPVIVVDPKGDLTNLLLTFPDLAPADFEPWVNEDDARRAGKSISEFAADQAARWRTGLAEWGEDGARITRLRAAADFTIYTPGSTAGVPVSALRSFDAPPAGLLADEELLGDRVQTTVSGLLTLVGIDADPLKSPEHILLSTILMTAWRAGENLDLASLVQRVQRPPMAKIGVLDVDAFFPSKDRTALALAINGLIAAPGFEAWTTGEPLDVAALLRTASGKPRVSIFSLAHLDDSQRMFFVSLLLNAVIGWMRGQPGTSSLRAMLYMDEIFGFFPPVANPPSKRPLLTLLKQARAFGVGVMLATQNPVDLDYKGLANIGTWWLGRLQTERDKARLLDGLESASGGGGFDRAQADRALSSLASRTFLMRNVHEDGLTVLQTRWTLSYLRGPLGRDEIRRLMEGRRNAEATPTAAGARKAAPAAHGVEAAAARPAVPGDVPQFFAPAAPGALLQPMLYGAADVRFTDAKAGVDLTRPAAVVVPMVDAAVPVDWPRAERSDIAPDALEKEPPTGARFAPLPAAAAKTKSYAAWSKDFTAWVAANESVALMKSPSTGEVSRPDESERDFRARLSHASREQRDEAVDALRRKYAPKQAALEERLRRARQAVERESEQATGQKLQTAISLGATLVTALLGRKTISATTIGRATTAARGMGRTMKESEDIRRAGETVGSVEDQIRQLDADLAAETAALESTNDALTERLETIAVKPKKGNVAVKLVALIWK